MRFNFKKLRTQLSMGFISIALASENAIAAGLPKAVAPTDGDSEGIIQTATNYISDGINLTGSVLCAWGLYRVVMNGVATYGEISDGKATYKDLGATVVVGTVLAAATIWMVTQAVDIF